MKITDANPIRSASTVARKKNTAKTSDASSDFLSILGVDDSSAASSVTPEKTIVDVQPVTSMETLLSLQEMPEDEIQNRKALLHGKSTIDALEKLRHSLLTGGVPLHLLKNLQHMITSQRPHTQDPRLKEIMDEIELRAAVELAKLENAAG